MNENEESATVPVGTIAGLVRKAEAVKIVEGVPMLVLHKDQRTESLEKLLVNPLSVQAAVNVVNVESFVAYFNRYQSDDSVIFVDDRSKIITAVFDYHGLGGAPKWGRHLLSLVLKETKEWGTWKAKSGSRMQQVDFAEHIQDNMMDIVTPDGATLLEIVTNLSSHRQAKFHANVRLDNGQVQFGYEEEIKGAATAGQVAIPQEFDLGIRPYLRCDLYAVGARLRYRITEDRKLSIWYELKRPDRIEIDAFDVVVNDLLGKLPQATPLFYGAK